MKKNTTIALLSFYFTVFFISCIPNITPAQTKSNVAGSSVHPSWSEQSNIYEVNLRQYTASSSIKDFEKSLPRLKKMGVEILWFMPINPIGIEERKMTSNDLGSYYSVRDYKAVNPEFGYYERLETFSKHK